MNFYKKLNTLNWTLLIFWLLWFAGFVALVYFAFLWIVKLIARLQGWQ